MTKLKRSENNHFSQKNKKIFSPKISIKIILNLFYSSSHLSNPLQFFSTIPNFIDQKIQINASKK